MDSKKPMLWTRVEQDTADEAQRLADIHYGGNLSMLMRTALTRFLAWLRTVPADLPPASDEEQPAA